MPMLKAVQALVYVSLFLLFLRSFDVFPLDPFDVFEIIKSRILYFLNPREAQVLIFGLNVPRFLGVFAHEAEGNVWEYFIKEMKIIFFREEVPWPADGQVDAIVYIAREWELYQIRWQLEEIVFQDEAFPNVPILILCTKNPATRLSVAEIEIVNHLNLNNVQLENANVRSLRVFVVDEFNREHYLEGINWLYDHLINH